MEIRVDSECFQLVQDLKMPEKLGFGRIMAPVMLVADYDGGWKNAQILPYGPISLDPCAKVLHYGQEIFEGMKAYKRPNQPPHLFRAKDNWERMNKSASLMAMPEIPEDLFMNGLIKLVNMVGPLVPTEEGASLYIRPYMFATQAHLGILPSTHYKFMIICSPSEAYLQGSISVLVERENTRATPGGTGEAKAGGNYAAALTSTVKTQKAGIEQTLWLDTTKTYVEELSGMNIFFVVKGELWTPKLSDTILPGITRDSVLKLAKHQNIKICEKDIGISEILQLIKSEDCTEFFACGTAAIIAPIKEVIEETGEKYPLKYPQGELSQTLRKRLLEIQEGKSEDIFQWLLPSVGSI